MATSLPMAVTARGLTQAGARRRRPRRRQHHRFRLQPRWLDRPPRADELGIPGPATATKELPFQMDSEYA